MSARTKRLLEAPVAPTLLRLAAPNVLVMVLQAVVATMDAVFVVWLGLFTADPQVQAAGASYLLIVGPTYGFFGLALALYFASQGAGRLGWPLIAGFVRLAVAAAGGWLGGYWLGWGPPAIYAAMALALMIFGGTIAAAVKLGAWR